MGEGSVERNCEPMDNRIEDDADQGGHKTAKPW